MKHPFTVPPLVIAIGKKEGLTPISWAFYPSIEEPENVVIVFEEGPKKSYPYPKAMTSGPAAKEDTKQPRKLPKE